jgi:putative hydrolase of the HAD superfamily
VTIKAALFDFGGVVLSSPFDAFARYEKDTGLPEGYIRGLNATNPDTNAWARFERSEVSFDEFCDLFEAEAEAAGHPIDARQVMPLLAGEIRPAMVEAVRRCSERLVTACLTNNVVGFNDFPERSRASGRDEVLGLFHHIFESRSSASASPTCASTSWCASSSPSSRTRRCSSTTSA